MPALDFPPPVVAKPARERDYVPPLENGDRLSGDEFMRRYENMPGVKAELINGIVYTASPVRHAQHGQPHLILSGWLSVYLSRHPDLEGGDNATIV